MRETRNATARRSTSPAQATPIATRESAGNTGSSAPLMSSGSTPPLLLNRNDVARELRCSTKSVNRLIARGGLPVPVQVGQRKRWRRDDLVRWIAEGCPDAATFAKLTRA